MHEVGKTPKAVLFETVGGTVGKKRSFFSDTKLYSAELLMLVTVSGIVNSLKEKACEANESVSAVNPEDSVTIFLRL